MGLVKNLEVQLVSSKRKSCLLSWSPKMAARQLKPTEKRKTARSGEMPFLGSVGWSCPSGKTSERVVTFDYYIT